MIGQSPRRKEDLRLITGRGRFLEAVHPPGVLHLVLVRSPHARARIRSVDTGALLGSGAMAFVADDLPELATFNLL